MGLGDYLIQKGMITHEDLKKALYEQKKNRIPLGQLAVQSEMITPQEMFRILSNKRKEGKNAPRFGRLAIQLEILTEEDINSLLKLQTQSTDLLGNVLVSNGALTKIELFQALKEFRQLNKK